MHLCLRAATLYVTDNAIYYTLQRVSVLYISLALYATVDGLHVSLQTVVQYSFNRRRYNVTTRLKLRLFEIIKLQFYLNVQFLLTELAFQTEQSSKKCTPQSSVHCVIPLTEHFILKGVCLCACTVIENFWQSLVSHKQQQLLAYFQKKCGLSREKKFHYIQLTLFTQSKLYSNVTFIVFFSPFLFSDILF